MNILGLVRRLLGPDIVDLRLNDDLSALERDGGTVRVLPDLGSDYDNRTLADFSPKSDTGSPPHPRYYSVSGVEVDTSTGLSYVEGKLLIQSTSTWTSPYDYGLVWGRPKYSLRLTRPPNLTGNWVFIGSGGSNYFHFIVEYLLPLTAVSERILGLKVGLGPQAPPYIKDWLRALEIPFQEITSKLISPEFTILWDRYHRAKVAPRDVRSLQEALFAKAKGRTRADDVGKVYFSRTGFAREQAWEVKLEQLLKETGWRIFPKDFPTDPIDLALELSSFKIFAGRHGAGLTNIILGDAGGLVVEIFDGVSHNISYEDLARASEKRYLRIELSETPSNPEILLKKLTELL